MRDGKNEVSFKKGKKATLPEKSWNTEDVDGHVHGMGMVGTIECDLKNQM